MEMLVHGGKQWSRCHACHAWGPGTDKLQLRACTSCWWPMLVSRARWRMVLAAWTCQMHGLWLHFDDYSTLIAMPSQWHRPRLCHIQLYAVWRWCMHATRVHCSQFTFGSMVQVLNTYA